MKKISTTAILFVATLLPQLSLAKSFSLWRTDLIIPFIVRFKSDQDLCSKYRSSPYVELFKKNGNKISLSPTYPLSKNCELNNLYTCTKLTFSEDGSHFECNDQAIGFDGFPVANDLEIESCKSIRYRDVRNIHLGGSRIIIKKNSETCELKSKDLDIEPTRCDEIWIRNENIECIKDGQSKIYEI